jgi:hypothetical protein
MESGHPGHPSLASPNSATQMDSRDPKTPSGFQAIGSEDTLRILLLRILLANAHGWYY